MAQISVSAYTYYKNGTSGVSAIVGIDQKQPRILRCTFTTPPSGATALSIKFITKHPVRDGSAIPVRYYIGTDPNSHSAAWDNSPYDGTFDYVSGEGFNYKHIFSATCKKLLLPNTTYYLWVFPGSRTYGNYNFDQIKEKYLSNTQLYSQGGAGLVHIDSGSSLEAYQCFIDNGSDWDLYMPYIDNGSKWDLNS